MKHLDLITLYHASKFKILRGEYAGKLTLIGSINFQEETVTSLTGVTFKAEDITPLLREIKDISYLEAIEIYKLYWGERVATDIAEHSITIPTVEDVIRIFQGKDYVTPDREEWVAVMNYCIKNSICFFS